MGMWQAGALDPVDKILISIYEHAYQLITPSLLKIMASDTTGERTGKPSGNPSDDKTRARSHTCISPKSANYTNTRNYWFDSFALFRNVILLENNTPYD